MADSSGPPEQPQRGATTSSPTPSPPLGTDQTDAESKSSRKREREGSLEAAATPSASQEIDVGKRERKDSSTRTPAKKNRRRLDTFVEEDDSNVNTRSRSHSVTPPLPTVVSPRAEMKIKVRQISQGVGDLNWRNMQPQQGDEDEHMHDDEKQAHKPVGQGLQEAAVIVDDDSKKDKDHGVTEAIVVDAPPTKPQDEPVHEEAPAQTGVDGNETNSERLAVTSDVGVRSDSEGGTEKGLKRKFLERGTSQGPPEDSPSVKGDDKNATAATGQEDARDAKSSASTVDGQKERTSPPSPKVQKLSGFMAYAATSSPFAQVKGNAFAASSKSSLAASSSAPQIGESSRRSGFAAFASNASPFASVAREKTVVVENQQPVLKSGGFASFGGSASPLASVTRSKSPSLGGSSGGSSRLGRAKSPGPRRNNSLSSNPFGSYASGGAQAFGSSSSLKGLKGDDTVSGRAVGGARKPNFALFDRSATASSSSSSSVLEQDGKSTSKKDQETDENEEEEGEQEPSTFGERLRAAGTGLGVAEGGEDEEETQKVTLEEQDVITGEEDDEMMMQVRGKLFALDGNSWKERGTGLMRLLVKRADGSSPRLVMRKDAVYTLLLNTPLFAGMKCVLAQDPRYVRFSVIEGNKTTHYNLKLPNAKLANEFLEEVNMCIPSA